MTAEVGQASFIAERPRYLEFPGTGANPAEVSDETSAAIDKAVRQLVDAAFARATTILTLCEPLHRESAQRLLEKETLAGDDLSAIGEAVRESVEGKLELLAP
jgi:cell division protease FtsH